VSRRALLPEAIAFALIVAGTFTVIRSFGTDAITLAPNDPAVADEPGTPAARLRIGRLGIDAPIVQGDGVTVPVTAAAHYPGTAWPGSGSNIYLYAHAREGLFRELWRVRTGDTVELDLATGGTATYQVAEILPLVAWDALQYLDPTSTEQVTLQTCLGYETTSPRFVVIARPATAAAAPAAAA
jgi:sortase A